MIFVLNDVSGFAVLAFVKGLCICDLCFSEDRRKSKIGHLGGVATLEKSFCSEISGFKPHFSFLSLAKILEAILQRFLVLNLLGKLL